MSSSNPVKPNTEICVSNGLKTRVWVKINAANLDRNTLKCMKENIMTILDRRVEINENTIHIMQ
jgi:septum formation topological specificity factor MinE